MSGCGAIVSLVNIRAPSSAGHFDARRFFYDEMLAGAVDARRVVACLLERGAAATVAFNSDRRHRGLRGVT